MGLAGCHQSEGECLKRQDELFQDSLKISDQIRVGWSYFFFLMRKGKRQPKEGVCMCVCVCACVCVCVCVCVCDEFLHVEMTHCEA